MRSKNRKQKSKNMQNRSNHSSSSAGGAAARKQRLPNLEKKQLRRLATCGISNFESVDKTQRRQNGLIRRLRGAQADVAGLSQCGCFICGRVRCAEGCPF